MAMQGKVYKRSLKMLNISQAKMSVFLGISSRQSRRVASETAELTLAAEKLIRVMLELGLSPAMVDTMMNKKIAVPKKAAPATVEA